MWTTVDTLAMIVLAGTVLIIVRWRATGAIISTILGYVVMHLIHIIFAGNSRHDQEALQEWPRIGLCIMPIWGALVYGITKLASRIIEKRLG